MGWTCLRCGETNTRERVCAQCGRRQPGPMNQWVALAIAVGFVTFVLYAWLR